MSILRSLLGICAICAAATLIQAQTNYGRISGSVVDSTGAAVPGCKVEAVNIGTSITLSATSDAVGLYVFPSLPSGTYIVRAEREGFRRNEQTNVILDAGSQRVIDFRLDLGAVSESVSVSAAVQQVQTTSGEISRVINDTQLSQIALNGRNYTQLLVLIPGSAAMNVNPFGLNLSTTGQRINGIRSNSVEFMLDGARNVDDGVAINQIVNPNVDAIAEVKVNTSSYSAEYGGRSGAMVNVVTKSGTQQFHGTLFHFVRNDIFDARSFFARQVDPLRFNNFGWTVGGPVYIPRRWNTEKNKLFFFYSQEWKFNHQGQTNLSTIPTLAERGGDFRGSALPAPIDPSNGQPFPDRIVPRSRFSRNGPLLLNRYPEPNFAGPGGNYVVSRVNLTDPREEMLRFDYYINPATQLTGRWTHDEFKIHQPFGGNNLGIGPNQRSRPGYIALVSLSQTISPTLLNFFSFSVTHNFIHGSMLNDDLGRSAMGLTYPEVFPANRSGIAPSVSIAGFTGYGAFDRVQQGYAHFVWRDDISKVLGSHTLKFGALISRSRRNQDTKATDQGRVTFNTSAGNTTRNAVADVLLGNFQNYFEDEQDTYYWNRNNEYNLYIQDSWKVNRRLSLELGMRYVLMPPYVNAQGNSATFDPTLFNAAKAPRMNPSDGSIIQGTGDPYNGIVLFGGSFPDAAQGRLPQYGDPNLERLFGARPRSGSYTNKNNWSPRLGLAYDPFGNGRTSVRAGFGIFYDRVGTDASFGITAIPPFVSVANIFDGNIDNPAGGARREFPSNVAYWPLRLPEPRILSWNFGIQQELIANIIFETNYVGTMGQHMERTINLNQLRAGTRLNPPYSTMNVNALRPYAGYADISARDHGDNSNYHALQLTASRRMRSGLSFGANYTFSKTLDSTGGTPMNSYDARRDYGLSSIHRAHLFNFNYVYELPFFAKHSNAAVRQVLGGWSLAGVTSVQSGGPNSVNVPADVPRIGTGSTRASLIADPNLSRSERTLAHWFNAEAFLPAERMVQGDWGNSGRNILIGPGFQVWDLSLLKNITISEKTRMQFRAESFNLPNHPNFTSINTSVRFDSQGKPAQNFGSVTGAGPGRILSFGLKLLF